MSHWKNPGIPTDITQIHWVVYQLCHFSGHECVVERRCKRTAASHALRSREYYADPDEFYYFVIRSDEAIRRGIK